MTTKMSDTVLKWSYDQRIPSSTDRGSSVVREVVEQLEKHEWHNKDVFGIHMAMEEAVMNAIKHGNSCDENKLVHIVIRIEASSFYALITDEGCGFNPDSVPDPTLEENLEKCTGRGVMLMKNFVDELNYNDKGNSVELKKKRRAE